MPGVEELLKELIELKSKRAVVTNSTKEQIETIKELLPLLKSIPLWITREDYENPKPAPDGYLKAMEVLADSGDRVIGFEDSGHFWRMHRSLQCSFAIRCIHK